MKTHLKKVGSDDVFKFLSCYNMNQWFCTQVWKKNVEQRTLGAIQLIRDTFLVYFRPPSPMSFGDSGSDTPTPTPGVV